MRTKRKRKPNARNETERAFVSLAAAGFALQDSCMWGLLGGGVHGGM